jgi:GNAT superfamily N-acetyltransferase
MWPAVLSERCGLARADDAFSAAERAGRMPWIVGMVVRAENRKRGEGRQLLESLQEVAASLGYPPTLQLDTVFDDILTSDGRRTLKSDLVDGKSPFFTRWLADHVSRHQSRIDRRSSCPRRRGHRNTSAPGTGSEQAEEHTGSARTQS